MVYGLSVAVHDCVVFKDARFRHSSFRDCPLLRFNEMPEVEVYMRHRACFPHLPNRTSSRASIQAAAVANEQNRGSGLIAPIGGVARE